MSMLPAARSLSRADFTSFPRLATTVQGTLFCIKAARVAVPTKFAIVISSKIVKHSVARHTIKRRAMEAVQKLQIPESGFSCILYAKAPAQDASYKEIKAEVETLLRTTGMLQ